MLIDMKNKNKGPFYKKGLNVLTNYMNEALPPEVALKFDEVAINLALFDYSALMIKLVISIPVYIRKRFKQRCKFN
jgi:hypothetical protein